MKRIIIVSLHLYIITSLLVGCGEDRTYEYEALTERAHWMEEEMKEWYLWGDSLKEVEWKNYFSSPSDFLKKLTAQAPETDSWSYCSTDTLEENFFTRGQFDYLDSYGLDFEMLTDPTKQTTKQYARIKTVYPGSPADECGMVRDDCIGFIDGAKATSSNMSLLKSGGEHTLLVSRMGFLGDSLVWETENDTLILTASRRVEEPQVMASGVYGDKGYVMLCNLNGFPGFSEILSFSEILGISELILDLRLCNNGTMEGAQKLLESVVPIEKSGQVFAKTIWNSHKSENNKSWTLNVSASTLGVERVSVITSGYTQGAAEWVVRGLASVLGSDNVYIIGTKTAGQNVMLGEIGSTYDITLRPAVAFVADAEGNYDYSGGITPDEVVNEFSYTPLYPYGDEREVLLQMLLGR